MFNGNKLMRLCLAPVIGAIAIILVAMTILHMMPWCIDEREDECVEKICEEFIDGGRIVAIPASDRQTIKRIVDRVNDDPRLFWMDIKYDVFQIYDLSIIQVKEKYYDIDKRQEEIDRVADSVVKKLIKDDMSDRDKALALYDWICENLEYGYGKNNSDQDIYGGLVMKRAVCAGYAKSFTYLLNKAGVEAYVVSGYSVDLNGSAEPHAWTLAYIDGELRYFDVTWDDKGKTANYDWFCLTEPEFVVNHRPGVGYDWKA